MLRYATVLQENTLNTYFEENPCSPDNLDVSTADQKTPPAPAQKAVSALRPEISLTPTRRGVVLASLPGLCLVGGMVPAGIKPIGYDNGMTHLY